MANYYWLQNYEKMNNLSITYPMREKNDTDARRKFRT